MGLHEGSKGKVCLAYIAIFVALLQWIAFLPSSFADLTTSNSVGESIGQTETDTPLVTTGLATTVPEATVSPLTVREWLARGDSEAAFRSFESTRGQRLLKQRQELTGEKAPTLDLEGAREALDPGTLLLVYAVGSEGTDVFVIDSVEGLIETRFLPFGKVYLEDEVDDFLLAVEGARKEGDGFFDLLLESGSRLYDELLAPFETALGRSDRLLIVPDGPLHRLPFDCLVRPHVSPERSWQFLIESKALHTVPSTSIYATLTSSRSEAIHSSSFLVALGDADYGPSSQEGGSQEGASQVGRRAGWSNLTESRREVRAVARQFSNHRLYLGKDATEDNLKALDVEVDILHISAHGQIDARGTEDSALILSPRRLAGIGDPASRRLEFSEILEGSFPVASLVVLATCNSALGPDVEGEGPMSLGWAFLASGARSVVSSHWSVDDRRTADLMERFYVHLRTGSATSEALRKAQIDLIKSNDGEILAPYFWAAFQVQGDWR